MSDSKIKKPLAEYHAEYYQTRKDRIREARKKRYNEDPVYREKIREQARKRKAIIREEKIRNGTFGRRSRKGPSQSTDFIISVGGKDYKVRMFTIGQLADSLGRSITTLRFWESNGTLPEAMYRSPADDRLYTAHQMRMLQEAYATAIRENGSAVVERNIKLTIFPVLAAKIWEDYPVGIDI